MLAAAVRERRLRRTAAQRMAPARLRAAAGLVGGRAEAARKLLRPPT